MSFFFLDLPVVLLKELLPHLNIYYLDRIEPVALTKGKDTQSDCSIYIFFCLSWFVLLFDQYVS